MTEKAMFQNVYSFQDFNVVDLQNVQWQEQGCEPS